LPVVAGLEGEEHDRKEPRVLRILLSVAGAALLHACGHEDPRTTATAIAPAVQSIPAESSRAETVLEAPPPDAPVTRQPSTMPVTFPELAFTKDAPPPCIADVVIVLTRTTCYGTCPAYTVSVRGDGTVVYEGESYVSTLGRVEAHIDPKVLEPILRKMAEIDFVHHRHVCESKVWDLPTACILLRIGTHSLTVEDSFCGEDCGFDKPSADPTWHPALSAIAQRIDEAVAIDRWIGSEEERSEKFRLGR
jgi:hypothetical protein